jgi:hypothetical protein
MSENKFAGQVGLDEEGKHDMHMVEDFKTEILLVPGEQPNLEVTLYCADGKERVLVLNNPEDVQLLMESIQKEMGSFTKSYQEWKNK